METQAITTTYRGPTATQGARIDCGSQTRGKAYMWDYALNVAENHRAAARQYLEHLGWNGRWIGGALPNGRGYVWVQDHGTLFEGHLISAHQCEGADGAELGTSDARRLRTHLACEIEKKAVL